jgi:hypothetical protein
MEKFIEKARKIHGNKYDYSKVIYINNKAKINIICPEHGVFEQTPDKHINRKQGCPKCSNNYKLTIDDFIKKSKEIHGDKYDYSQVLYINNNSNVKIICPIHGIFEQVAKIHMNGSNCPMCYGRNKKNDDIINILSKKHNNKYDYSLVNYINPQTPIKIICPKHGIFEQTFNTHKNGHECPKCHGLNKTNEEYINEAKEIHGNKYDYSLVNYIDSTTKIDIICLLHGTFNQMPSAHLQGQGCPKCKGLSITEKKTKTTEEFINAAKEIHGDKYDYSNINYTNCKDKILINCPEHGEFQQVPDSHLQGCGCPKCSLKYDKVENELKEFITSLNIEIIENSKKIIPPLELDIYIPSKNIAIEYNGLYWHSEINKPSNYHLNKTNLCQERGIQLIHIFEDEWLNTKNIVKSRLRNILGLTTNKIYARKCIIKEISIDESKNFLNSNHLQGHVNSSIKIGLYYNDELVSLMTFGRGRIAMGGSSNDYELLRFCNKLDRIVIGAADKLFKYFIKMYFPKTIISYADKRWSIGNLYEKLKFIKTHESDPNYWYIIGRKRKHRFGFRKSILVKKGFDSNKTEHEIMIERGIYRIYDCGTIVYKKTLD